MVELCHEIGAFIQTICFHQSIKYVLLIDFHQTSDFLTGYDLNNHLSVEFCINSKYCVNYKRLKTEKNKENHKVTHSAQVLYDKVWQPCPKNGQILTFQPALTSLLFGVERKFKKQ